MIKICNYKFKFFYCFFIVFFTHVFTLYLFFFLDKSIKVRFLSKAGNFRKVSDDAPDEKNTGRPAKNRAAVFNKIKN